jgi:hypothetical protein
MFAREHRCCRKESRRYYRNEFGHSGNLDISADIIVQNAWRLKEVPWIRQRLVGRFPSCRYGHKWDVLRTLFGNV